MDSETATAALEQGATRPMGLGARLINIFINPTAVFESIRIKPAWATVVLILSLLSLGVTYVVVHRIGADNIITQQMKNNPMLADKSDAELQEMASKGAKFTVGSMFVFALLASWIVVPLIAGLIYLVAVMFGGTVRYKNYLSLTAHTFWMYSLATSTVLVLVVFLTSDPSSIDMQNAVQANLGVLLSKQQNPVMYSLASSLDLFTFWHLAILGLGISVLNGRGWGYVKSLMIPLSLWVIYVGIKAAFVLAFAK